MNDKTNHETGTGSETANIKTPATNTKWTPETVLAEIPHRPAEQTSSPAGFFHLLERLKTTKREGWCRFGISTGESISDHMYRMSLMTMLASPDLAKRIDIPRCMQMALIHDMAESLVGDITPMDGVPKKEKSRREEETMDYICKGLLGEVNGGINGEQIKKIWKEYEDSETPESHFVHDIDKLELMYQMVEYERAHKGKLDLSEFCQVADRIETEEVKQWCADVMREREAFWTTVGITPKHDTSIKHKEQTDEYYSKSKE
ncbi:hypothetical protein E2P81_ATG03331 [Venturia nashicola]|uniref:5'-deoxynucleotidase n=1 Tax=Venturia nashicola TaxID=86259 RepID=A0A4Z1PNE5_9PEZI|nr:hypothetical protein E6O75_ATG03400 [Venturia nashicola]TLD36442.1 hypothetical protein E2P81_ATG03331 [Venturia nashicola]